MATSAFHEMKPFPQLMFSLFVMIASVLIFMILGMIAAIPFFDFATLMNSITITENNPNGVNFLKYFQTIQSIGLFVVPPFILASLFHGNIGEYLKINRSTRPMNYLLASVSLLLIIPFINFLGAINGKMSFPDTFSGIETWMRNMEDTAGIMVEQFMKVTSLSGLLFNVFMIAVLPAIGEELMFRGVVQRIFTTWTKNHHWGIWISAFLFSAMHLQFYGFLPRMALGALFGYMLVWTGSMWIPMLAHFVNNLMGVLGYFLMNKQVISKDVEELGAGSDQLPLVVLSATLVGILLFVFYRNNRGKIKMPVNQADSQAPRID
jgi:membrane protease YdiL (CAAX protease family)